MCIRTGIRDVYQGVQGACPRRAVTRAEGMAERRAVGAGLRLVCISVHSSQAYLVLIFLSVSGTCAKMLLTSSQFNLTRLLPAGLWAEHKTGDSSFHKQQHWRADTEVRGKPVRLPKGKREKGDTSLMIFLPVHYLVDDLLCLCAGCAQYQVPTFKPSSAMFNPLGTFFPRPIHRQ